jgi:hypothetical protein
MLGEKMRDFSRKYVRIDVPESREDASNRTSTSLPKRDALLLRTVFALPKASSTKLEAISWSRIAAAASVAAFVAATCARKKKTCFVFSVLPAPDSPEEMID